jgi:UDP-2-acetamido-2,6-beta-L-arabino-hexul-4-ose reductase
VTKLLRIGITGADGFLGWHLRAFLHGESGVTTALATRATFQSPEALARFAGEVDAIVHLAGMNRGDEIEIRRSNVELAHKISDACELAGVAPHIVFANSTHHVRPGPYGESKRAAAEHLATWAERHGARFTNLILPHLFGESGRPFYNSAVATFCHQLAIGELPRIIDDGEVELLHAQTVARDILQIVSDVRGATTGEIRGHGHKMRVSQTLARLTELFAAYREGAIPSITSDLDWDLFNTLRSYLFPQRYPLTLRRHADSCGSRFAAVQTPIAGECMITTTSVAATRGNQYHRRTFSRLVVVHGNAIIRIRKLFAERVYEFHVNAAAGNCVDLPTLHTYNISNIKQEELVTLHWVNGHSDSVQSDTYNEQV